MVPLFISSTEWWFLPFSTETGRRHPCHGAVADSLGPIAIEIPQLQFIDQVFDVLVAQVQQIRAKSWESVEIPQLQFVFSWTGCCSPVACNNKCPWSMTPCSSSTVVDVPVIIVTVEAPQIQFIADMVDIPARNRDRYLTLQWQR